EVGDDAGDGHRVVDVGLARVARLPPVGLGGTQVGTGDQVGRRLRVAAAVGGQHRGDLVRRRALVAPPRQDSINGRHVVLLSRSAEPHRGRRCSRSYTMTRLRTSRSVSLLRPSRNPNSTTKPSPTTAPPNRSTSRQVAVAVPPVASTSSTT